MRLQQHITGFIALILFMVSFSSHAQYERPVVGVLNIPTKGVQMDSASAGSLVRLELEKISRFQVLNKYEMLHHLRKSSVKKPHRCLGKTCLVKAGHIIGADKMLSGKVERFGDKIIVVFRLINVEDSTIEKTQISEYVNQSGYLQNMIHFSLQHLLGKSVNDNEEKKLLYQDATITTPTKLVLNGPRFGAAFVTGEMGRVLQAPRSEGGYDMYPFVSQFGYQHELQYLSAGNVQGLFEFIGFIGGLDQGAFIPTLSVLNGFRHSKTGLEFAFGPTFGIAEKGYGFYDTKGHLGQKGKWYLSEQWTEEAREAGYVNQEGDPHPNPYDTKLRRDSRTGDLYGTASWVWAVGKTFKSGNLNIPVNAYVSPSKRGWYAGMTVGFNMAQRKTSLEKK